MDLGITKCVIIGCPNRTKLGPQAFIMNIQFVNINFRTQPMPMLNQHALDVYLGISLVSFLQWETQVHATATKLMKHCKLLATLKQNKKNKKKHDPYNNTHCHCL